MPATKKNIPELRFPEFDNHWNKLTIGTLNLSISDGNYGEMYPKADEMKSEGIPFIRANNIKGPKVIWDDMYFISEDLHSALTSGHLKTGDILITTRGDIGNVAYVSEEFNGANINAQLCLLRVNGDISSIFLLNYLSSSNAKRQFYALQTGSALKQLPKGNLAKVNVVLPPYLEQQKIADFLASVDEWIENLEKQKEAIETYKKGMMQKIFSQKIRFKDDGDKDFPKWNVLKAGEIFINNTNKNHDGELPLLAVTQTDGVVFRDDLDLKINSSKEGISNYKIIEPGDFVISLRSFQGGIEYSNIKGISSPAYTVLKNKITIAHGFYKQFFKTVDFINKLDSLIYGIRDGKQINYRDFKFMKLPYPSVKEQHRIAEFLSSLDLLVQSKNSQITKVKQWKKGLLQQMFV